MNATLTPVSTPPAKVRRQPSAGAKRFGYVIGIVFNVAMYYVAHRLLEWEWPSFLTTEFNDVLPYLSVSLIAGMITNALFIGYDAAWFKSVSNIVTSVISFVVGVQMYQVFPFDFSGYETDWAKIFRFAIVVGLVAIVMAVLVEVARLLRRLAPAHS